MHETVVAVEMAGLSNTSWGRDDGSCWPCLAVTSQRGDGDGSSRGMSPVTNIAATASQIVFVCSDVLCGGQTGGAFAFSGSLRGLGRHIITATALLAFQGRWRPTSIVVGR